MVSLHIYKNCRFSSDASQANAMNLKPCSYNCIIQTYLCLSVNFQAADALLQWVVVMQKLVKKTLHIPVSIVETICHLCTYFSNHNAHSY